MAPEKPNPKSFYYRFALDLSFDEAKEKFVARAHNRMFEELNSRYEEICGVEIMRAVADALGKRIDFNRSLSRLVGEDFFDVLKAIEGIYRVLDPRGWGNEVNRVIAYLLSVSEIDLGIRWQPPFFVRAGAEELDEKLVNDNLLWLRQYSSFKAVLTPFEKGLRHLVHSQNRPELLSDVITDMYEALEALAKVVTGRDTELSGNAELFIKTVKASDEYKVILKHYMVYANRFRHAVRKNQLRPVLSPREGESFVYLTGLFIRLALPTTSDSRG